MNSLCGLGVSEVARQIREGALSPVELLEAYLERIESVEPRVRAWVLVDRVGARRLAGERLADVKAGRIRGPLHGVPVGFKDIYHVAGMVTTAGAGPFAHERPAADAQAVAHVRAAGAVVLGKTTTTEFAYLDPAGTRNPWNPEHTPGGSSSGSAAAVASGMLPLALGSQTVGSTLRPAAYCGAIGFKPTHGRISCAGVVPLAWSFDHVGVFCRRVEGVALTLQVLAGYDPADPFSVPAPVDDYVAAVEREPVPPHLGIPRRFVDQAGAETIAHVESVAERFRRAGARLGEVQLPPAFEGLHGAGMLVVQVEATAYHQGRFGGRGAYREKFRSLLDAGAKVPATDYAVALKRCRLFRRQLDALLEGFDALLMPVAGAPAPKGLASTGDPAFCAPWSFAGVPAIALPSGIAGDGLPLGVQLVGASFGEAGLLATARWCEAILGFQTAFAMKGGSGHAPTD